MTKQTNLCAERPTEADLARRWQIEVLRQEQNRERLVFRNRLSCRSGDGRVRLARVADSSGEGSWAGLDPTQLLKMHAWIMGATGSGKTFEILGVLWQLLRSSRTPIVVVDRKGELSELLLNLVLPSLWDTPRIAETLPSLRVIRPFDPVRIPLLRLTDPEPGVSPEIQALNLASSLEDALGQTSGIRMDRAFLFLVRLAIELGLPLTVLSRWLSNPASLARDGLRSQDSQLREYARIGFGKENASSLSALAARLDSYLFLPETRLALSAPRCLSLQESLQGGLTLVDVGNPPAGAERVARFWGAGLIGRLSRAIMGRNVGEESPRVLVVLEEFQECLSSSSVEQFSRLLALSRFKKVALWFINQQPAQLSSVDTNLPKLLRTNTGLEMVFRSNCEDAKTLAPALFRRFRKNGRVTAEDHGVEEIASLPDREFYLWLKKEPFGAQRVRSPRLDLKRMKEAAHRSPDDIREAIHRGTVTIDRAELEAALEAGRKAESVELLPPAPLPETRSDKFPRLG